MATKRTPKISYRATFSDGIATRNSHRQYTHAWRTYLLEAIPGNYSRPYNAGDCVGEGFAGSLELAHQAVRQFEGRWHRTLRAEVVPVEVVPPKVSTRKPHWLLTLFRPDYVAECWPTGTGELYCFLWNELVPRAARIENIEDCGPSDVVGIGSVASLWKYVPENYREQLNTIAARVDAEEV